MGSRINKINIGNTDYELEDIRVTFTDDGKISSSVLPSYVDDVLEYNNKSSFPSAGETGKIYVDKSTNLTYRWGGSSYVEISPSIALGEVENTAYPGNLGQANAHDIVSILDGHSTVGKAESDGNGNNIVNTYATKSSLSNTNSNIITLQGYFDSGIAKKATADKNGKDITTEYVHTRVEAGPKASTISHQTTPNGARVGIYAEDGNYGGSSVYASTYGTVLNYTASGGQNSCSLELTETGATLEFNENGTKYPIITTKDTAGFEDILKGITGRTQVEWNALNKGEYGSNSTYNGTTLPPVILENNSGFWNSASGKPLDVSFHFTKKEKITTLQVKCPPYGGVNPTMTVYYAQNGDAGLTLYKEIATISTADRKAYEFNEEGISADYWVVRFTSSGWIDLRLCSPSGLFTTGLYTEECHQQIMDKFNGYQPIGNYALKNELNTTNTNVSTNATNITTLQGYFSSGIAKKAKADKNGNDITTEYVHTRVDGGTSSEEMYSEIVHNTNDTKASVFISAENTMSRFGGNVYVSTDYTELYYGDGRDGCALKLTSTDATLQFVDMGPEYSIITTKDTATANDVGVIKAAAVRTSAITTTTGKTTTTGYYGVELDSDGKAFVAIPWSAIPTSLVPSSNDSYNLGSSSYKWSYVYANYIGSSSYKVTTAYITNIGSSSYKTNYVYANYIGHASYPCTAVYTNKLQFDVANYITNIASGSFDVTMSNGTVGTQASYNLTIPNHSTGKGTWHVFATITGAYCNSTFVGVGGEVSSTGGCTIWVRNGYASASRTITIHWLAVKF